MLRFTLWLRDERPDVVLDTSWNRIPTVSWAARRAGVPRVVVRLGIVRALPRSGRHTRAFGRRVDALIVNSDEIRREWIRSAPWFPAEAVHVVHNGVRLREPARADERARLRERLGLPVGAPLVVGVGHVYPSKGFDLLIDALAASGVPEAHLVIVGAGPHEGELRARADRLRVGDRVHWTGFRDDVPEVVGACDVFVLSSRNEGMANAMLEAMAAGTPVIATEVSGVAYALGAEGDRPPAGWTVPLESAGELARRRVRERFDEERMVLQVESVLQGTAP